MACSDVMGDAMNMVSELGKVLSRTERLEDRFIIDRAAGMLVDQAERIIELETVVSVDSEGASDGQ